jgi:hypothetical protein
MYFIEKREMHCYYHVFVAMFLYSLNRSIALMYTQFSYYQM